MYVCVCIYNNCLCWRLSGGKVHISEATYYALCDIGGFSMARRTENFRNRHGAANHGFADTGVGLSRLWGW